MTSDRFDLFLFSTDPALIREAVAAGVDGIIVDWEERGKPERQASADTEINHDTPEDLRRVRQATSARVICRINGVCETTEDEIETAIGEGADEILLPMVRAAREVEAVLELVDDRCDVGILTETEAAVRRIESFAGLPLSRVYVGLNDLSIERGAANIFTAVADGTVARVRSRVTVPFGFGGLTLPEGGRPIPCRLLMSEMTRLHCQFSFLRRSFRRDSRGRPLADVVGTIRAALAESRQRSLVAVEYDRLALEHAIAGWDLARAAAG
jgi:hypothetical protein